MRALRTRILCGLTVLAGCAAQPIGKPVVWPEPPDTARIRFVTAFHHNDDLDRSGWANFRRTVVGGSSLPGIKQPMGVAISKDGRRLYIADFIGGHLMLADLEALTLKPFPPDAQLDQPVGVALDDEENIYVAESASGQVVVYAKDGTRKAVLGKKQLERPMGLALDARHHVLYVADAKGKDSKNHRVRAFDLSGKLLFDLGPKEGPGGTGNADGQFFFPLFVAVNDEGDVFVGDTMNFRIQVFGPDGKFKRKFGEAGDGFGTFQRIKGLAFDGFGALYVVDGGAGVVQIFNRKFDVLMAFGGAAPKLEFMELPSGIAIDRTRNRIYLANQGGPRINVYDLINTQAADLEGAPTPPAKKDPTPTQGGAKDANPTQGAETARPNEAKPAGSGNP